MPPCLPCSAQWHFECVDIQIQAEGELTVGFLCCCSENNGPTVITPTPEAPNGRKLKDAESVRDITSTGRKRAAQVKPIEAGMVCEWAGLKYAGGGVLPIIGCAGNLATNIHHGPDKNTLNNEWENLHRICATCHNRWHEQNDPFYGERPQDGTAFLPLSGEMKPHDPETKATEQEIADYEKKWKKK